LYDSVLTTVEYSDPMFSVIVRVSMDY